MRTTHHKNRGTSHPKKIASKAKHDSGNVHARLARLMMISLHASDNARARLETHVKLAGTGLVLTKSVPNVVPAPPALMLPDKGTIYMDDPGKARAHLSTLTKPPLNHLWNGLARHAAFANDPTHTTKLTKDIINGPTCLVIPGMKPMHASGSARNSLSTRAMRLMTLTYIRDSAIHPP